MGKQFQKRPENFPCQHCGAFIVGNGYTNHCPHCLWSRHVDKYPGDREESCGGMMAPVLLVGSSPNYRILHKCDICGFERINDMQADDSTDAIVALAKNPHPRLGSSLNKKSGEYRDPLAKERTYPEADLGDMGTNLKFRK